MTINRHADSRNLTIFEKGLSKSLSGNWKDFFLQVDDSSDRKWNSPETEQPNLFMQLLIHCLTFPSEQQRKIKLVFNRSM